MLDLGLFELALRTAAEPASFSELVEEMKRLGRQTDDLGPLFAAGVQFVAGIVPLARYGCPRTRDYWLPKLLDGSGLVAFAASEPTGGSDIMGMQTHANRSGSSWRVDGTKSSVSNITDADVVVCIARTARGRSWNSLSAFVVGADSDGISIQASDPPAFYPMSLGSITMNDVDADGILGHLGAGLQVFIDVMTLERVLLCAPYVGYMHRQILAVRNHLHRRSHASVRLTEQESVRQRLAMMQTRLTTATLHLQHATNAVASGKLAISTAAMAKVAIVDAFADNSSAAADLFGAAGFDAGHMASRALSYVHGARLHSGTTDMLLRAIETEA